MLGQETAGTGHNRRKPDKTRPSGTRGAARTTGSSSPIPLLEHCDFNLGLLRSLSQLTADPVHLLKGSSAPFPKGQRGFPGCIPDFLRFRLAQVGNLLDALHSLLAERRICLSSFHQFGGCFLQSKHRHKLPSPVISKLHQDLSLAQHTGLQLHFLV